MLVNGFLVNGFLVNGLPYSTLENTTNIVSLKYQYIMQTFSTDIVGFFKINVCEISNLANNVCHVSLYLI